MTALRRLARLLLALVPFAATSAAGARADCGDTPCEVAGGSYHLAAPAGWDGTTPLPAVLFFHGYGASGASVLADPGVRDSVTRRGYLLIAPNGRDPEPGRNRSWAHQGSPFTGRDENAFIAEVMADTASRLPLRRDRVLVSGFSQGGSMAWHVACFMGRDFAAFAPVAGAFWQPEPPACPGGPVRLLHLHGFADEVVPLEGRAIGDRWQQGDVFLAMARLREIDGCRPEPDRITIRDGRRCRAWTDCAFGGALGLCLHDGGHELPQGWLDHVLDWFEAG